MIKTPKINIDASISLNKKPEEPKYDQPILVPGKGDPFPQKSTPDRPPTEQPSEYEDQPSQNKADSR